jgi:glutathione synthase/RimK-type ligase-like ATP-grasp enzyme
MARLVLLTPEPSVHEDRWPETYAGYAAVLGAAGLEVGHAPWTGPLPEADAYCPLLSWGYHLHYDRWRTFLDGVEASLTGERLINPVRTCRWNGDKGYLLELAERGAPVPPTLALEHATPQAVELAIEGFGVEEVVVKPRVSGGAHQTVRVRRGETIAGGPERDALVQPFMPAVSGEGEWSLFRFGDRWSHALTKVAAEGDFRVQPQFGGRVTAGQPPAAAMRAAEAVLHACPHPFTYGRVDLLADGNGGYFLMELELIEPFLFLEQAGDGGAAFAAP